MIVRFVFLLCAASALAAAPSEPPRVLPTSPAAVERMFADAAAAEARMKELSGVVARLQRDAAPGRETDLAGAERAAADYAGIAAAWRALAGRHRLKPAGYDVRATRELTLPPPPDAAARRAAFAQRNDPAALAALAHRLCRGLDPAAPGLGPVFTAYRNADYAGTLAAFRDHLLAKLAQPERHGVAAEAFMVGGEPPLGRPLLRPEWAEDALRGIATQPNRHAGAEALLRFDAGEPGAVNWAHVPAEPRTRDGAPVWLHVMRQWHMLDVSGGDSTDGLRSWLIGAYQKSGDVRFLRRWAEYADDWALNMQRDLDALPAGPIPPGPYDPEAPLPWNVRWYPALSPRVLYSFLTRLRGLVLEHPATLRELPAPTLARVLLVALDEYLAPSVLVGRASRFNWNMMGMSFNARLSMILGEFRAAQWAGREAAQLYRNYATFSILPDGGYVEYSDEGHQGVWVARVGALLQLMPQQRPPWADDLFLAEMRESVSRNARFLVRHLKPDGYRHRDDYRAARDAMVGRLFDVFGPKSLDAQVPWVTDEPEVRGRFAAAFGGITAGPPAGRSDVMPYHGQFMLRGGWGRDDPFFYLSAPRIPNANPDEDSNAYKLHAFGRHLLTGQPVYVDGRTQNAHFDYVDNPGAKTKYLVWSDGQPAEGRWHTSEHFDLAEGIYEGAYEDRPHRTYWSMFQTGGYDMRRRQRSLGLPAVTDVRRHARQVFFLRELSAWIVVDRLRTDSAHEYEVPYELYTPVGRQEWQRRAEQPIPQAARRVEFDAAAGVIRTDNPGFPRVTLQHFSPAPLAYSFAPESNGLEAKTPAEVTAAEREWRQSRPELKDTLTFVRRVLVRWSGRGDQVFATLITVAAPGQKTGWTVSDRDGTRFTAVAPDGTTVAFAAAAGRTPLMAGGITAEADTLLVVRPRLGAGRGVALDCASLTESGRRVVPPTPDLEFVVGPEIVPAASIHAPIKPVTFEPGVNVFTDVVDVAMHCATPGVDIRYTLDGSEPGINSPLYRGPVRLTATAVVKAIAVRPGTRTIPWSFIPGFASLSTHAVFTRQNPAPATARATGAVRPGLRWETIAGQPFALVANSDTLPAQARGVTQELLDVAVRPGPGAFIARYEGWLNVPADGVYTLHAPREFVIPAQDCGYDLRVFVDEVEWTPTLRWHALGTWSRALARGAHRFKVIFTDTRATPYKHEAWLNWPNPAALWTGRAPVLEISGPGVPRRPVPAAWLSHDDS